MPITPSGTRTLRMRSPFGLVHSASVSPNGIGQCGDVAHARGHVLDALRSQQQAIAHRAFQTGSFNVFLIRGENAFSCASMASAIASSKAFFCAVESWASCRRAARARSSFSAWKRRRWR